jgi:lysozyme family protein
MSDLAALKIANAARYSRAKLLRNFTSIARHLVEPGAKARYQTVSARTSVPWWFIAVVHERESSQSWKGSLAQGDPWDKVSIHVPANRGPFKSWEDAAVDALMSCPPFAGRNRDWSIGGALTMLEQYNGLGYFARGIPSPYIWAGTDQYSKGKFVRDGVFDANAVDNQLGCAGLLSAMQTLDAGILLSSEAAVPPPAPAKPASPSITQPAPGSIGAAIAASIAAILSIFRRKS